MNGGGLSSNNPGKPVVITGGAGFIGSNLADRLLSEGEQVLILDNLSRTGAERNLHWLKSKYGDNLKWALTDVRDRKALKRDLTGSGLVYHLAAQVAVTTSVQDPVVDFESNLRGTLNVLEAVRNQEDPPSVIFTSTNKVYGALSDIVLKKTNTRYEPQNQEILSSGISESRPLSFHSPYGCSKGAADQYVLDYARIYGIKTAVFRMSCIYGPRQFGTEDQGWIAHFLLRSIHGEPIHIYGSGMQVRDILFIEDLVDALLLAGKRIHQISGEAFNMGGGPQNTISLIELLNIITELQGRRPATAAREWRPGDQRYYASNTGKFRSLTDWTPRVDAYSGVKQLYLWLLQNHTGAGRTIMHAQKVSI